MPRTALRTAADVGPFMRLMYRYARRRFGKVPEPFMAFAHNPRFVLAAGLHGSLVERPPCVDFGTMVVPLSYAEQITAAQTGRGPGRRAELP
jgi:hypothetical protein